MAATVEPQAAGAAESEDVCVARLEDLAGGPVTARCDGVEVVAVRVGHDVSVFQGACPHQGISLGSATLEGSGLTCSGHGWCFDGRTGERIDRPGACLHRFDSTIRDGAVYVRAEALRGWAARDRRESPHAPQSPSPRRIEDLPGPRGLPVLGSLLSLRPSRMHLILDGMCREYGETFRLKLPQGQVVVLSRPATIRAILRDRPGTFRRTEAFPTLFKEVGAHGVFSEEGETWARQRRLITPALNTGQIRGFAGQLDRIVERLQRRWLAAADAGTPLDARAELTRFTVDVTTNLAFGYDMNAIEADTGDLLDALRLLLDRISARAIAPFPYWRYVKLPKDRAFDRALPEVQRLVQGFVDHARAQLADDPNRRASTLLEALVSARTDDGEALSDEEIHGNVLTLLVAGEDTTANTMAWMVHFMTERPDVQARMQQEADEVLGDASRLPSLRDAERLRYIDAVTHEAMRLEPVAPLMFMQPNHDVEIEGIAIPEGTTLFFVMLSGGRRDDHFTDSDAFAPERWLDERDAHPTHTPDAVMPFGHGPRHCPGRSLAMVEIRTVMAMLARNFHIAKVSPHPPVEDHFGFTMNPTPITVNVRRR